MNVIDEQVVIFNATTVFSLLNEEMFIHGRWVKDTLSFGHDSAHDKTFTKENGH